MSTRDRNRSLLLVALVFALGVAVPKLVGVPIGSRARLAGPARSATHHLAPSERAALPGLTPAPTATSHSDLAFAG